MEKIFDLNIYATYDLEIRCEYSVDNYVYDDYFKEIYEIKKTFSCEKFSDYLINLIKDTEFSSLTIKENLIIVKHFDILSGKGSVYEIKYKVRYN